jgi:hypothetical protein
MEVKGEFQVPATLPQGNNRVYPLGGPLGGLHAAVRREISAPCRELNPDSLTASSVL